MSRLVYYAMNPEQVQAYVDHKNNISAITKDMTPEKIEALSAEIQKQRVEMRNGLTIDEDGTGHINVVGPLEPKPDPCAIMFNEDMTTYSDIINEAREADANPEVKKVIFHFDTPGGNVVGVERTAKVIRDMKTETQGIIEGDCCSAGLWLASQCDRLESEGETQITGSLGVVVTMIDRSESEKASGVVTHTILSKNAPNKRLNASDKADREKMQAFITKIENVFVNFVASGRNATPEFVRENYGQGSMLLAREALNVGMIDAIQSELTSDSIANPMQNATESNKSNVEGDKMEISEEKLSEIVANASTTAATKAATQVKLDMTAELEKRDLDAKAESERIAGFEKVKAKFPEMSAMIEKEQKISGATADLDFFMKVADADKSRVAALAKQESSADDKAPGAKTDSKAGKETDNSGTMLASVIGLKIGGVK